MEALAEECKTGFARKLASPNKKTREKAISLLVLWLTSQKQIEEDELKKIWKGLFYCVWHSDKLPVQADLIERLASVSEKLDTALSVQFFKVFLVTMRREWAGIDRLRLDKFYLLLRKCLVHMLVVLESSGWDADLIKEFMDAFLERAFLAKDQYAALGINLHHADIFLQELEKFLPLRADTFRLLLEPFLVVSANASDKCLLQRIRENIFGRLLDLGCTVITAKQEGNPLESGVESLGSMALSLPLGLEAFRLASMPSTSQANRKLLYELHKEYETLEKLLNTSGVTLSLVASAKKKKKKKDLGQIGSIHKRSKSEMKQKRASKASGKKATGGPAGDTKAINNFDTVNGTGEGSSILLEVFSEGTLSTENKAGEGKVKSSKRKVSDCQTDFVLQSKQQEVSGGKRKKAKQRSSEKGEKVGSHEEVGVKQEHNDLAEDCRLELQSDANGLSMDDPVVSNLEKQFDLLAAEEPIESDTCLSPVTSISVALSPRNTGSKKRKRAISTDTIDGLEGKGEAVSLEVDGGEINGSTPATGGSNGHSSGKVKRVRFSLKKNLEWRPSSPLPPESVRVPPSATPRGSALKKGVPPGPIISAAEEMELKQREKGTPRRPSTQSNMKKNRRTVPNKSKAFAKRRKSI